MIINQNQPVRARGHPIFVPGFWDGKLLEVIGAAVEKRVASCKTQDPKQRVVGHHSWCIGPILGPSRMAKSLTCDSDHAKVGALWSSWISWISGAIKFGLGICHLDSACSSELQGSSKNQGGPWTVIAWGFPSPA